MRKHFKNYGFLYALAAFFVIWTTFRVIVEVHEDNEENKCLSKGYHYVHGTCYKTIIPE